MFISAACRCASPGAMVAMTPRTVLAVSLALAIITGQETSQCAAPKRIALVAPGLPWQFGPYQRQQYLLSLGLHRLGHAVSWLNLSPHHVVPERRYATVDAYCAALGLPAPDLDVAHLDWLGRGPTQDLNGRSGTQTSLSRLNELAAAFGVDAFVTLLDGSNLFRDAAPAVPMIAWFPSHFEDLAPPDLYLARGLSAVAPLAPTATAAIARQLGPGGPVARHASDRKGWMQGILAFAKFYAESPDDDKPHLYVHGISSLRIAEAERSRAAPPTAKANGVPLRHYLWATGLPAAAWTLDEALHAPPRVAGLKRAADACLGAGKGRFNACLHPSKTEGFGLNVLECQLMGTPVVTTKTAAMADYTVNGEAVPYRQTEWLAGGMVATPDVDGVAAALHRLRARPRHEADAAAAKAKAWLEATFSSAAVAAGMDALLADVLAKPPAPAKPPTVRVETADFPDPVHWDADWTLLVDADVDVNEAAVAAFVSQPWATASNGALAAIVPCVYADGSPVPYLSGQAAHPHLPVIVRGVQRLPDGLARFRTRLPGQPDTRYEFLDTEVRH
ncbi:glycosyl transferase [Aureococcus anophagefferens]|nr:glycosyl transferase [Aureococcus anophagefferens]